MQHDREVDCIEDDASQPISLDDEAPVRAEDETAALARLQGSHIMRTSTAAIAAAIAALVALQSDISAKAQGASATEAGTDIGTFCKDEEAPLYKAPGYSPYAGRNYPTRVLWG